MPAQYIDFVCFKHKAQIEPCGHTDFVLRGFHCVDLNVWYKCANLMLEFVFVFVFLDNESGTLLCSKNELIDIKISLKSVLITVVISY